MPARAREDRDDARRSGELPAARGRRGRADVSRARRRRDRDGVGARPDRGACGRRRPTTFRRRASARRGSPVPAGRRRRHARRARRGRTPKADLGPRTTSSSRSRARSRRALRASSTPSSCGGRPRPRPRRGSRRSSPTSGSSTGWRSSRSRWRRSRRSSRPSSSSTTSRSDRRYVCAPGYWDHDGHPHSVDSITLDLGAGGPADRADPVGRRVAAGRARGPGRHGAPRAVARSDRARPGRCASRPRPSRSPGSATGAGCNALDQHLSRARRYGERVACSCSTSTGSRR